MCRRSSHSRWRNRTIAAMTLSLIARGLLAGRRDLRVDRLQAALVIPLESRCHQPAGRAEHCRNQLR